MKLDYFSYRLRCIHPFGISRSTLSEYDRVFVYLTRDGIVGRGEAAPSPRYGENTVSIINRLKELKTSLSNITGFDEAENTILVNSGRIRSLESALSMAWLDWYGQATGKPVYSFFNGNTDLPVTSFTIAIGDLESIPGKIREAADYPVLKVKLGTDYDREIISTIREYTDKPLRIDANEGWDLDTALKMTDWLSDKNVEFIEQPLPAAELDQTAQLREESPLKIFADENSVNSRNIPQISHAFDGINIKLSKCGTLFEAKRMIDTAKSHGLLTMLGCMIESSIGIAAAGHLASLVNYADLDGNLLINNDPYKGLKVKQGRLSFPDKITGLGLSKNQKFNQLELL